MKSIWNKAACLSVVAFIGIFVSCGPEKGHTLAESNGNQPIDSMLYYYGQMAAVDYWHQASADSTMVDQDSIEEYLKGLEKGLKSLHSGRDAYNRGVEMGVRMAINVMNMERNYGVQTDVMDLYNGMAMGLRSDSSVNEKAARRDFFRILSRLRDAKNLKDSQLAIQELTRIAGRQKMYKINDLLWCRIMQEGHGKLIKRGEIVTVDFHCQAPSGRELDIELPREVQVTPEYSNRTFINAIETMKVGEKSQYATTALSLLGIAGCERYKLYPSDIILFTITVNSVKKP